MKIVYVCSDPGVPVCGNKGASIHVSELTRSLRSLGHDVTVLTTRSGGAAPSDYDVPIIALEPDPLDATLIASLGADTFAGPSVARDVRSMIAAFTLRERALPLLRSIEPDLIYERYALFGTAGVALARELSVPLILEVNAALSDEQERHRGLAYGATARQLERIVLGSADHVVAVSSALERWVVGNGVAPERVAVLPNAVDPARFGRAAKELVDIRAELGLADRTVVGFLGTLKPWHDVATLVRAVAMLRDRHPSVHLLVVGDGPERASLEALVGREWPTRSATFTGSVPHGAVASYLGAFDVAVVPYGDEPEMYFSPLKLFECLASGRPVVAADVGDIGHCIQHGSTGLLYRPGDAQALAAAVDVLLSDRPSASVMARAAREHVVAHHTWLGNARRIVELAGDVLGRRVKHVLA